MKFAAVEMGKGVDHLRLGRLTIEAQYINMRCSLVYFKSF